MPRTVGSDRKGREFWEERVSHMTGFNETATLPLAPPPSPSSPRLREDGNNNSAPVPNETPSEL